jgi:hypothetical protein
MANWIFIVTGHKFEGTYISPEEVLSTRLHDSFWGLGEKTPNRRSLMKGDSVIFYMGLPRKAFVAQATLASDSFTMSPDDLQKYGHNSGFYKSEYGVLLQDCLNWQTPIAAVDVIPGLEFIENKEFWYSYFQGGVRQLSDHDYQLIVGARETPFIEKVTKQPDLESVSQFALEAQLEEFLDTNWDRIDFGRRLSRFAAEEQTGRQFPAGPWSIDFLCIDEDTDDLVVVELKRGKTSDATVGQVLRYLGWVRENLAKEGQDVSAIIIAAGADEALRYAVSNLPNVEVLTYKVDFKLGPMVG